MASAFSVKMGVGDARTQERQFYLSSQRRPREPLKIRQCALLGGIKICGDQLRFKKEQKMNWADVDIFGRSGFSTLAMLGIEQSRNVDSLGLTELDVDSNKHHKEDDDDDDEDGEEDDDEDDEEDDEEEDDEEEDDDEEDDDEEDEEEEDEDDDEDDEEDEGGCDD